MRICAILIGIPSFRRPQGVKKLLDSLAEQTGVDGVGVSVLVADNDPERQEARRVCSDAAGRFRWPLQCEVVQEQGVAAARNRILEKARASGHDFIAMLDDDQAAAPDWLSQLLAVQRDTSADAVGGRVRYEFAAEPSHSVRRWGYFNPRARASGPVSMLSGAGNILLSCAALERLDWPMFDVQFGASGGEDAEFFARVGARGFRFAWAERAIVSEEVAPERTTERALLNRAFRTGNNEVRIGRVNGQSGAIVQMTAKSTVLVVTAPVLAPLLLTPSRLWLLSKWASALGRMAGLLGRTTSFYGSPATQPKKEE